MSGDNRVVKGKFLSKGRVEWSVSEIEVLKKYYNIGGAKLCVAKGLDRSISSIQRKANKLGIHSSEVKVNEGGKLCINKVKVKWLEWEEAILREYYPKGGAKLCIEKGLDRSESAIKSKAKKERILKHTVWSKGELVILRDYYPKGGAGLCIEKGLDRSKVSIQAKANEEGIVGSIDVWSETEIGLLREYYPKGGSKLCIEKGLDREIGAIYLKAYRMGLSTEESVVVRYKRGVSEVSSSKYTDIEDAIITKYYRKGGAELCISKGVERSLKSVYHRANKLGIKRVK